MQHGDYDNLRQVIIDCLDRHTEENRLIEEIEALIASRGPVVCQVLLHILTSLNLEEEEAQKCWLEILGHRQEMNHLLSRDINLQTAICDYFTAVRKSLKNPMVVELHIYEKTLRSSHYDGLTNLFNRLYFDAALEREIAVAKRQNTDVSLLFFDVDDFKQINDECGHQIGDAALVHLAKIILDEKRIGDIAARYGGEEIVIILPYTSNVEALVLGERIRQRVEKTPLDCGDQIIAFTVSGGLVSFPTEAEDALSLIKYADSAMYRAKGSGKNNISFFSKDKRRYLRIACKQPLVVRELDFNGQGSEKGTSKNICLGGLLFETNISYPIGSRLQLRLPINDNPLLVIGTVVRVEQFGPSLFDIGLSLSFQEMDKLARKEISRYLGSSGNRGGRV